MELQEPLPRSYVPFRSYFKKNKSVDHPSCFFSYKELKKATNNFTTELGRGGYGAVFRGELQDNRTVAVKVIKDRTQKSYQQFNNEVELLSGLQHKNLVAFYGSTKPDEELLLVYEYVPNRNLAYHLHLQRLPIPWTTRIKIAIEIAEGIFYLHSLSPPIIHRDVKTDNILVDNAFHVKVADFGLCRLLPSDDKGVFTVTPGTAGYQDPEYKRLFRVTDKSDVYSFGVVLLELISRQMAVDVDRGPEKIYLDEIALDMITNKELEKLVDPEIGYSNDNVKRMVDSVVELACRCLKPKGDMRPAMVEVLRDLKAIDGEMQGLPVFDAMYNEIQLTQANNDLIDFMYEIHAELPHEFTYNELKKATNSFDTSQQLGQDGFGRTYRGKLPDGQMVAVKVLFDANPRRLEVFIQQVMILSRLRHKNLIALYGCTFPHDEKLLVVYEFVPKGTVADHLHRNHSDLSWAMRIKIAVETAEALQYLHELAPPVIHCDVKTSNIMLDDTFHVKVADLASPGLLPWDTTHVLVAPQGTLGYRDPEYDRTLRFNVKSDVYSFGVVLLELISGKEAIDVRRDTEEIYLVDMALNKITHKKLEEFVDPKLGYQSDNDVRRMIDLVAELAYACLQPRGGDRPPIMEVLKVLKGIQNGHKSHN